MGADIGQYSCVIDNACTTVITREAMLQVNSGPTIVAALRWCLIASLLAVAAS